jgi:hypothetical protein
MDRTAAKQRGRARASCDQLAGGPRIGRWSAGIDASLRSGCLEHRSAERDDDGERRPGGHRYESVVKTFVARVRGGWRLSLVGGVC